MSDVIGLDEAARHLGVTRRRVNALVAAGDVPAHRVGRQWVVKVDELRNAAHHLQRHHGRPMTERTAWNIIREALPAALSDAELDELRRRLRTRAGHHPMYVHPGVQQRLRDDPTVRLGGRDAADAADLPIDRDSRIHAYVDLASFQGLIERYLARPVSDADANVVVHVVGSPVHLAPFDKHLPLTVAWLDLEDDSDRAARLVLDKALRR